MKEGNVSQLFGDDYSGEASLIADLVIFQSAERWEFKLECHSLEANAQSRFKNGNEKWKKSP